MLKPNGGDYYTFISYPNFDLPYPIRFKRPIVRPETQILIFGLFGFFEVKCAKSRTKRNHRKHQKTKRKAYRSQLTLNIGECYRASR